MAGSASAWSFLFANADAVDFDHEQLSMVMPHLGLAS